MLSIQTKKYHIDTLIAATVAAIAAATTAFFSVSPWIMFIGWVAYFTNPGSINSTIASTICVCLGVLLGIVAAMVTKSLIPQLGAAAFGIVVFVVAICIISLRKVKMIGNIPAWFLGMITYFAAHPEPSTGTIAPILAAIIFGAALGCFAHMLQIKSTYPAQISNLSE